MKRLYLAGPINACSDSEAKDWRESVKTELAGLYEFSDPMQRDYRGQEHAAFNAIVSGDMDDIQGCDVILANCPKPSVGTSMEVFYASFCLGKRVISVVPSNPSPWLIRFSDKVLPDIHAAIEYLKTPSE